MGQRIPVDMRLIMPQGNDIFMQILSDACIQCMTKLQKCFGCTAIDTAADIIPPYSVRNAGCTAGITVICELVVRLGIERRMLYDQQLVPFFSPRQEHFLRYRLHELRICIKKEDIVERFQRLLLL